MDVQRKQWNERQQALRQALGTPGAFETTQGLFAEQHALVHAGALTGRAGTFDDDLWRELPDEAARCIPPGGEHSIAWCLWHAARIEDVALNVLVAGSSQVWEQEGWGTRLKVEQRDAGNAMDASAIAALSEVIDLQALRAYRTSVGARTREIVASLRPEDLRRKVTPERLQRVQAEGAVDPGAEWLLEYWGGLKVAGLLLMPPTRHNLVHLNEAQRIRQKAA